MENNNATPVGIDDMSVYVPHLYLPIETLAHVRGIEYAKLNKGLGLTAMAIPDAGEDAATMMANAVRDLLEKNNLAPQQIGRIYLGTESALDGAKPTATYALQMLQDWFGPEHGADCLLHCDVIDMTFACIGAVDALHNSLDWVRGQADRLAIVVAADNAKYELGSTGEYTQGAGAVAMLLRHQPRLLAVDNTWGVSTRPVYDFYKPLRRVKKADLITEALQLANRNHVDVEQLVRQLDKGIQVQGVLDGNDKDLYLHKDTPVFDGPYSNDCYQQRIGEALEHFTRQRRGEADYTVAVRWDRLVFHLPYAFQARRMFGEVFWKAHQGTPQADALLAQVGLPVPAGEDTAAWGDFYRGVTKTPLYRAFVDEKIAPSEQASSVVGNMYAGSILLALMSTLEAGQQAQDLAAGATLGFFAYGSGSKSKVFQATLQPGWESVVAGFRLFAQLEGRMAIDYDTYEQLHRGARAQPVAIQPGVFYQSEMDDMGIRTYALPQKQQAD